MNHAALPLCVWQILSSALHQAAAGIRDDEPHALEAAIDQVAQERRPPGLVLLGTFADAQNLPKTLGLTALATSSETLRTSPAQVRFITMTSR